MKSRRTGMAAIVASIMATVFKPLPFTSGFSSPIKKGGKARRRRTVRIRLAGMANPPGTKFRNMCLHESRRGADGTMR